MLPSFEEPALDKYLPLLLGTILLFLSFLIESSFFFEELGKESLLLLLFVDLAEELDAPLDKSEVIKI